MTDNKKEEPKSNSPSPDNSNNAAKMNNLKLPEINETFSKINTLHNTKLASNEETFLLKWGFTGLFGYMTIAGLAFFGYKKGKTPLQKGAIVAGTALVGIGVFDYFVISNMIQEATNLPPTSPIRQAIDQLEKDRPFKK